MSAVRRVLWAIVGGAGYLLSPLSWWNDLYVNLPIAYLAANAVSHVDRRLFLPGLAGAYWLTNIAGLLLLHAGAVGATGRGSPKMGKRGMWKWLWLSVLYTLAVVALSMLGIIRPLSEYTAHPR
jgi:hypothetical protein